MSKLIRVLSHPLVPDENPVHRSIDPQHPMSLAMEYEDAFELTGHGLFNYLALSACSLIFIHASLEMAAIGYIITPAECDLRLSVTQKSMINSGIFFGILFTAIIWGSVSDYFGRRKVMLPALFGAVVVSFCSSLCTTFWLMFVLRIITGCLVSASSATVLVYLGEVQTDKYRDWSITFTMAATQIAFAILPLLAWAIIPGQWSFHIGSLLIRPWRVFMWLWGLVGLSGAIILILLPESPRYILAKKGPLQTLPILARMFAWNHGKKKNEFPVTAMKSNTSFGDAGNTGVKDSLKVLAELIRPPIRRCFLISHFAMVFIFALAYGFYIWLPDFINDVAADMSLSESICKLINRKYIGVKDPYDTHSAHAPGSEHCEEGQVNTSMYPMAIGMELIYLVPFVIIIFIIDKFDKKKIYGVVMVICVVGLILCSLFPQILVALILMIIGVNCVIGSTLLSALLVEYFPTSLRSFAMCSMFMMGHIGAILGNNLIGLMAGVLCEILFILIALCLLASAGLLWKFWPSIKKVKEEMEARNFTY